MLVYDGTGRHPALQGAEKSAGMGADTTFVSIDGDIAAELTYAERAIWKQRLYKRNINMKFDHRLRRIERVGNQLTAEFSNEATGSKFLQIADEIVVEHGTVSADDLYHALRKFSTNDGVTDLDALLTSKPQPHSYGSKSGFVLHRIGDAVTSRNIAAAIYDALRLCHIM